jgi:hypothetical protein
MQHEVAPLFGRGVAPDNLYDGYRRFAASSAWTKIEPILGKLTAQREHDPYDTHPALEDRIAYAERLDLPDQPMDDAPGASLLEPSSKLEEAMSRTMVPDHVKTVSWAEAGAHFGKGVLDDAYRWQVRNPQIDLGTTMRALSNPDELARILEQVAPHLTGASYPELENDRKSEAAHFVGSYIGALLAERGFLWRTAPGEPISLEKDGRIYIPHRELDEAFEGKRAFAEVEARILSEGITLSDRLAVPDEAATRAKLPRASVRVRNEGTKAVVLADFAKMTFPRCCAICCGPSESRIELQLPFGEGQFAQVVVGSCSEDEKRIAEALKAIDYRDSTDTITLEVKSTQYADLIARVNI